MDFQKDLMRSLQGLSVPLEAFKPTDGLLAMWNKPVSIEAYQRTRVLLTGGCCSASSKRRVKNEKKYHSYSDNINCGGAYGSFILFRHGPTDAFAQSSRKVLMIPREGDSTDLDLMITKEVV